MISTNPSTVSGLIWTNERCPLCYLQVSEDNLTVATTGSHGTFILPTSLRVDQTYSLVSSSVSLLVICKIFSSKNIQNIFSGPPPGAPPPPRYPQHPHFLQNKAETAPIRDWHHALLCHKDTAQDTHKGSSCLSQSQKLLWVLLCLQDPRRRLMVL